MIILIFKVKITSLSIQISLNNYIFRIECLINWNKWDKCSHQDKEQQKGKGKHKQKGKQKEKEKEKEEKKEKEEEKEKD